MKNAQFKTSIMLASCVVLIVAGLLFVNALSLADFSLPGQGLFQGRSNIQLGFAFALLAGLSCALLFMIFRADRSAQQVSVAEAPQPMAETVPVAAEEQAAPSDVIAEVKPEAPGEVLADTAGELRTSVEVIQEELEEILDEDVPADKQHMQSLYDETDRLKKIIAGMETLSRVQAIAAGQKKETLQIEPLLKGIIETTQKAVPDRNVTYNLECEAGLTMQGNAECIGLVIGNIAENAAQAIRDTGSVTLTASLQDGMAVFCITDTGTGIRRAHLSHIYERYFRGSGSGIGMGLAIAKELVDACNGTIAVRTALKQGTTFTVRLPTA